MALALRLCHDKLGFWQSNFLFNEANYSDSPNRRFALANINHFVSDDRWTLEFSSADNTPMSLVTDLYHRVARATFVGKQLQLFLNTARLETAMGLAALKGIPVVVPDEIYARFHIPSTQLQNGLWLSPQIPSPSGFNPAG